MSLAAPARALRYSLSVTQDLRRFGSSPLVAQANAPLAPAIACGHQLELDCAVEASAPTLPVPRAEAQIRRPIYARKQCLCR